jgi:hypothetical protein
MHIWTKVLDLEWLNNGEESWRIREKVLLRTGNGPGKIALAGGHWMIVLLWVPEERHAKRLRCFTTQNLVV